MEELPTILIVDDRKYDRILYKEYLGGSHYQFEELDDGDSIMRHLEDSIPDVIILDWQMPKVNGLEVLKQLKRHNIYQDIPVIVVTGMDNIHVLQQAFDYGSVDFIQKPVKSEELVSRIQNILNRHQSINNLSSHNQALKELNEIIQYQKEQLRDSLEIEEQRFSKVKELLDIKLHEQRLKIQNEELELSYLYNEIEQINSTLKNLIFQSESKGISLEILQNNLKGIEKSLDNILERRKTNNESLIIATEPEFVKKLLNINPSLTALDIQHCTYLKHNISNHEVARIMHIELKSLQTVRYRLKKKLNLDHSISLRAYLSIL